MLSANSTRDINQAARAASKYLQEVGFELPHAKALDLVARMLGKPHHMAAQAGLPATGLPKPAQPDARTDSSCQTVPATVLEGVCRILVNTDVDKALWTEGISDAAYAALASAAPYLPNDILAALAQDVLDEAADNHRSESTEGLPTVLAQYIARYRERQESPRTNPLKAFRCSLYRESEDGDGERHLVQSAYVLAETSADARKSLFARFWHPQYDRAHYRASYETHDGVDFPEDGLATYAVAAWLRESLLGDGYSQVTTDSVWRTLTAAGAQPVDKDHQYSEDRIVDALRAASKSFKNASALLQALYAVLPGDICFYVLSRQTLEELDSDVRFAD